MNLALMIPLSAATVGLGALYLENKFQIEKKNVGALLPKTAPMWQRLTLAHYSRIRATGLVTPWVVECC